jgi:hypothetical protein
VAEGDPWPEWPEDKYVRYLHGQRARYAWVMRTYGDMSAAQAEKAADLRYPYQPPGTAYRGLIFHDDAWHWAMRALKGEQWWLRHPELVDPPDAYRARRRRSR